MTKTVFKDVFYAYRAGLLERNSIARAEYREWFDILLRNVLLNNVPLNERLLIRRIWAASSQGLHAARNSFLEDAENFFARGKELLTRLDSRSSRLLAATALDSAEAYLYHRRGDYGEAQFLVSRSMDADVVLEHEYGFHFHQMHRVQAVHNIVRIGFRKNDWIEAFSLAGNMLAYLDGHLDTLPVHHSWQRQYFVEIPRILPNLMTAQIADEVAVALRVARDPECWPVFRQAIQIDCWAHHKQSIHPGVRLWLLMKDALAREQHERYLQLLTEFLPVGRFRIDSLWYASVLDFVEFCGRVDTPISRYTRSVILKESVKWPGVHTLLEQPLELERNTWQAKAA